MDNTADFIGYLQYLCLDGKKVLINGDKKHSFRLPDIVNVESLENAAYENCQKYSLDYVSTENIKKWAIEVIKQYHLKKLEPLTQKDNKGEKPKEDLIALTPDLTREIGL